jgi:hypothetical protein
MARPSAITPIGCAGHTGVVVIKPEPDMRTTHDTSTPNHSHDPERRLPY